MPARSTGKPCVGLSTARSELLALDSSDCLPSLHPRQPPEQCAPCNDNRKAGRLGPTLECTFDPAANGIACALNDGIDDAFGFVFTLGVERREELLPTGTGEGILPMRRTITRAARMIKLGANATLMKPMHIISGTIARSMRTPNFSAKRPVRSSCENRARARTMRISRSDAT